MQAQEQVMEAKDHHHIIKGKRTKRPRTSSPLALTMATTSSCSTAASDGGFGAASDISGNFDPFAASPLNSDEHTDEEEDMANCLILLAKGQTRKSSENPASNKTAATVALEVYQCKTCNRSFPSFQALGGHRASHKKPKTTTLEENPKNIQLNYDHNTILSLQMSSRNSGNNPQNKSRVHECSICGAEFNSGQALGGHMRRHRPMPLVPAVAAPDHSSHEESKEAKKTRNLLSLDLNLPAPEPEDDDLRQPKFPFTSKEIIVFSNSPLVDCHY